MVKTIMASLTGLGGDRSVLECSIVLAKRFDAQVECLHVRLDEASALALGRYGLLEEIEREQGQRSQNARREFEDACKRHSLMTGGAATDRVRWHQIAGIDFGTTSRRGRLSDLVVAARDSNLIPGRLAEIVMKTGRPVLVAPPKATGEIGDAIAVAWKDGPESARALTAAMPLLKKAKRVVLISIPEDSATEGPERHQLDELRIRLSLHGLQVEIASVSGTPVDAAEALRAAAYDANCDVLVMGAYGHSRLREYVFGGVTRDMLADCALPILMFH